MSTLSATYLFSFQEVAEKNKTNRTKVKHHQSTGSRSYISHLYTYVSAKNLVQYVFYLCVDTEANFFCISFSNYIQMEKNKDHDVNAVEMFKECHTSKKNGMTDQVKETLVSPYTSLMDGLCTYVSLYSELVAGCDYHMPQFV